jgi:N-acetylglucosamine-6-phosphate deacetylase
MDADLVVMDEDLNVFEIIVKDNKRMSERNID